MPARASTVFYSITPLWWQWPRPDTSHSCIWIPQHKLLASPGIMICISIVCNLITSPCSPRPRGWARPPCRTCPRWRAARGSPCRPRRGSREAAGSRPEQGQRRRTCGNQPADSLGHEMSQDVTRSSDVTWCLPPLASAERERHKRMNNAGHFILWRPGGNNQFFSPQMVFAVCCHKWTIMFYTTEELCCDFVVSPFGNRFAFEFIEFQMTRLCKWFWLHLFSIHK